MSGWAQRDAEEKESGAEWEQVEALVQSNSDQEDVIAQLRRELAEAQADRDEHVAALEVDRAALLEVAKAERQRAERAEALAEQREVIRCEANESWAKDVLTLTAERDEFRQLILTLRLDCDDIRRERDQALLERDGMEASCAALRETMRELQSLTGNHRLGALAMGRVNEALSTTAGADLLERLQSSEDSRAIFQMQRDNLAEERTSLEQRIAQLEAALQVAEKAAGEEAICKRQVTDKYADYCIERNERVEQLNKALIRCHGIAKAALFPSDGKPANGGGERE